MKKRFLKHLSIIFLSLMILFVFGCDNDSDPISQSDDSVTLLDMDVVTEDFSIVLLDEYEGLMPLWFEDDGVIYGGDADKGDGNYTLSDTTTHQRGGITATWIKHFFDVDDNMYQEFDPETTVRVERTVTKVGEWINPHNTKTVAIDMFSFMNVAGFQNEDNILTRNGNGYKISTIQWGNEGGDRSMSFDGEYEWTVEELSINRDRSAENHYPLSGIVSVIAHRVKIITGPAGERTFTVDVEFTITFDGTNIAIIEHADGTTYELNLDDRRWHRRPGGGGRP
jgi:hypothetical protein